MAGHSRLSYDQQSALIIDREGFDLERLEFNEETSSGSYFKLQRFIPFVFAV